MSARISGRSVILILAGIAAVVLAVLVAVPLSWQPTSPVESLEEAKAPQQPPKESWPRSLDCAFHDMMRTSAVVSYYFDVVLQKGEEPRFYERAIVSASGVRTNFHGNERPVWTYGVDSDGQQTITSPDGATRIMLYGLKLGVAGVLPVEAGIRSNEYRNLGGECRQTNLVGSGD